MMRLDGRVFCFTGELRNWTRVQAVEEIMTRGASYSGSVTKNTTDVVVGTEPGVKVQQALRRKLPLIYEKEFADLLGTMAVEFATSQESERPRSALHQGNLPLPKRRSFNLEAS